MQDEDAKQAALDEAEERKRKRYEIVFGLVVAVFAAVLGINELASGKYGDDELKLESEKSGAYLWYQSKGIKQSLAEGQRDLLKTLRATGSLQESQRQEIDEHLTGLDAKIARYEKEKTEILLGSKTVGEGGWSQEVDGQLGKIVGVKEMERELDRLNAAGDRFDVATLFLQLALVFGAVGILVGQMRMKQVFLIGVVVLGIAGSVSTVLGLHTAGFFSLVPVAMALDGHEVLPAASLRDEIERQKETRVHE
jgi:hypothetical protein